MILIVSSPVGSSVMAFVTDIANNGLWYQKKKNKVCQQKMAL